MNVKVGVNNGKFPCQNVIYRGLLEPISWSHVAMQDVNSLMKGFQHLLEYSIMI